MNKSNKKNVSTTALNVLRGFILYLSFCAAGWYSARGVCAYYGVTNVALRWVANDAFAFFVGGVVPFALYKFLIPSIFNLIANVSGDREAIKLSGKLEYTYAVANVICFLVKLIYIAFPLASSIMNVFVDFVITGTMLVLFLWYTYKKSLIRREFFAVFMQKIAMRFLLIYGLVAFADLFVAIMQGGSL